MGFCPGSIFWYSLLPGGHLDKPREWAVGDVQTGVKFRWQVEYKLTQLLPGSSRLADEGEV